MLKELRAIQTTGAILEQDEKVSEKGEDQHVEMDLEGINSFNFPSIQRADSIAFERTEVQDQFNTPRASRFLEEGSIKTHENGTIRTDKRSRRKWKDGANLELRFREDEGSQATTLNNRESPPRIKGYRTPMKEENFVLLKGTSQVKSQIRKSKWLERRIDAREDEEQYQEEEEEDNMFKLVNERMPIDILVQICVANVIEEQTRLV